MPRGTRMWPAASQPAGGQRKGLRVFALGQRLRHFADHVTTTAGEANGARPTVVSGQESRLVCGPRRPADAGDEYAVRPSAMDRKLFIMKGFYHPGGSQQAFVTG